MKTTAVKITPDIQYRRLLNKLNLEMREKIADVEMFYPFDTFEKEELMNSLNEWKETEKARIYQECYNRKPGFIDKLKNIFRK